MKVDTTYPIFCSKASSRIMEGNLNLEIPDGINIKLGLASLEAMNQKGILSLDFVDFKAWKRLSAQLVYGEMISRCKRDLIDVLVSDNTPLVWDCDFKEIYFVEPDNSYSIQDFQKAILKNIQDLELRVYSQEYNSYKNTVIKYIEKNKFDIFIVKRNSLFLSVPNSYSITINDHTEFKDVVEGFLLKHFQETIKYMEESRYLSEFDHIPLFDSHKKYVDEFCNINCPNRSDLESFFLRFLDIDQIDSDLLEEMIPSEI